MHTIKYCQKRIAWSLICFLQKNEIKQFSSSLFRLNDETSMKNMKWFFFGLYFFFSFNIFLLSFLVLATQKKKTLFLNILFPLSVFRNLLFIYLFFLTKQSCLGSGNHFLCKAQKILTLYSPAEESHHLICFLLGIASRVAGEYCQTFRWYIDISFSFSHVCPVHWSTSCTHVR